MVVWIYVPWGIQEILEAGQPGEEKPCGDRDLIRHLEAAVRPESTDMLLSLQSFELLPGDGTLRKTSVHWKEHSVETEWVPSGCSESPSLELFWEVQREAVQKDRENLKCGIRWL